MTLDQAQHIFQPEFLQQLTSIRINGNFGDIVMNPQGAEIVEYFRQHNSKLSIMISTNGGARDRHFWTRLARSGAVIDFCLDGLADTHHLYRQNTVWDTVIRNAKTVIQAGGRAVWKMIRFDHNQHQIDQCRLLSQELGFEKFELIDQGRNTAPVFDQHGNLVHVLGNYTGDTDFKSLLHKKNTDNIVLEDIIIKRTPSVAVDCETKRKKSIYISATGDVSPCCWTGFYPRTYGHGQYHQAANAQLLPLINKNNALQYKLDECLTWFSDVEKAWQITDYRQGRLVICDDNCGQNQ